MRSGKVWQAEISMCLHFPSVCYRVFVPCLWIFVPLLSKVVKQGRWRERPESIPMAAYLSIFVGLVLSNDISRHDTHDWRRSERKVAEEIERERKIERKRDEYKFMYWKILTARSDTNAVEEERKYEEKNKVKYDRWECREERGDKRERRIERKRDKYKFMYWKFVTARSYSASKGRHINGLMIKTMKTNNT